MIFSPIIAVELSRVVRRPRFRVACVLLAILLLAGLCLDFAVATRDWWRDVQSRQVLVRGLIPPQVLAESACRFFYTFTYVQLLAVLALTPAYAAGAIAQEKERRNLELLLATGLDAGEIVFGKFVVRVAQMLGVLCAGMPVLAIASLMGGVSLSNLLLAYVLSASVLVALAGTSMLVSVFADRVWDAVLGTYALAGLVFFLLPSLCSVVKGSVPALAGMVGVLEPILMANNPLRVLQGSGSSAGLATPMERIWPLVRNMTVWGVATLGVAIWQLRPAYFRQLRAREQPGSFRLRRVERPPIGDQPVLWRERFSVETGLSGRIARWMMIVAASIALVVLLLAMWLAVRSWILPDAGAAGRTKHLLQSALAGLSSGMSVILLLAVAVRAAIAVAMERDGGTLDALLISPLTGQEIVHGKLFGAFWGLRWAFGLLLLAWAFGVVTGVVIPIGPLVLALDLTVFTLLSATIGLHYSILVVQPVTAVAYTTATWLVICASYMLFMIGPANLGPLLIFPVTPGFVYVLGQFETSAAGAAIEVPGIASWLTASLVWDAFFLTLALFFYRSAARHFDVLVGRAIHRSVSIPNRRFPGQER